MAKSKKCKKASHVKNRDVAVATSRRNKLAKLTKQVKKNPADHVALNALNQIRHDLGLPVVTAGMVGDI